MAARFPNVGEVKVASPFFLQAVVTLPGLSHQKLSFKISR